MKKDLDSLLYPMAIDEGLGRLAVEEDYGRHVDQLIRQVLLTNPGERINRPDFGCGVRRMLFAPNSDVGATLLQASILQAMDQWLGSVILVEDVAVDAREETLVVTLRYLLRARGERRYLNVEVSI